MGDLKKNLPGLPWPDQPAPRGYIGPHPRAKVDRIPEIIQGPPMARPVINGVDVNRVGSLLSGRDEPKATDVERVIAKKVWPYVEKLRANGISLRERAVFARQCVITAAQAAFSDYWPKGK